MSTVAEEMRAILEDEDALLHYGMPRRSGRYPWGSGEDPFQHGKDFLGRVEELRKQKFTFTDEKGKVWTGDTAIAKSMGLTSTQFRTEIGLATDERRMLQVARAKSLREDGLGNTAIGREMGLPESTVRSLLNEKSEARMNRAKETAAFIKKQVDERGMIDVGAGVEQELRISKEKLDQALYILEREGYPVYGGRFNQVTNKGQMTTQKVICPPGTEHKDIYQLDKVHSLNEYISRDGGQTYEKKFYYPESMDSKRLMVRYNEDGGLERDGLVELRRGVADLSLGESRYSQVRILVDGTHYIKGMAAYSDDMPDGVDVVFNTNKKRGTPMEKVLKEIKADPDNPFGSTIKDAEQGGQYWYDVDTGKRCSATDPNIKNKKLGLINKRADEGDWNEWSDALPSQFLSKQSKYMAKKQLDLARIDKTAEYDSICELQNPTIKKHLLADFANNCDAAAVHLKAAALPGQKYHVIIPINTLKDNEVYAPGYEPGTKLALIRYPHGGTFEIPILTVTHKNDLGDKFIGKTSVDAVGVNSKVAERLSGADFDGDTVMCIPTHDRGGKVKITSTDKLEELEGFDPKEAYPERPGMRYMKDPVTKKDSTQMEMGTISNLITDMTLAGATRDELARAVKHSMVVIDAAKHKLDYKQSELDNNIRALKKKYQQKVDAEGNVIGYGGATTLLSKSSGEKTVLKRQGTPKINQKDKEWYDPSKPEGALVYKIADDVTYEVTTVNKRTGKSTTRTRYKHQKTTNMGDTDDAYSLVSPYKWEMELIYADHANSMKALANKARMEMISTGKIKYDATANKTYNAEVKDLMEKLRTAELNKTKERAAQRMANAEIAAKKEAGQLEKSDVKKASQQALSKYRQEVGSISRKDRNIVITDREWEAIQAGAISETQLKRILNNTDIDKLRERATPRSTVTLNQAKINRIQAMGASNFSISEIASKLNVSTSTVAKYLKGGN